MQKVLLISALVATASGKAMPRMNKKYVKAIEAERKMAKAAHAPSSKATAAEKKIHAKKVAAVLERDGVVNVKGSGAVGKIFEIHNTGGNDCMTNVVNVFGVETGRCQTAIDVSADVEFGVPMSEMWYKPNNFGFPIMAVFEGGTCDWDHLIYRFRMPKLDLGYAPDYTVGDCQTMYGGAYYSGARWVEDRHEPNYNAVMQGDSNIADCEDDIYMYYHIQNADMCLDADIDGASLWLNYDVTNCNHASSPSVDEILYSDDTCTTMVRPPEKMMPEHCLLDLPYFNENLSLDQFSVFEWTSRDCHLETAP